MDRPDVGRLFRAATQRRLEHARRIVDFIGWTSHRDRAARAGASKEAPYKREASRASRRAAL